MEGPTPLTLRITFEGMVRWAYEYVTQTGTPPDTFREKNEVSGERTHDLGPADELPLDSHSWRVVVGRVSENEEEVAVTLTWIQEVDGQPKALDRVVYTVTLKKGVEGKHFDGSAFFMFKPA
jgi:hypothetical protein